MNLFKWLRSPKITKADIERRERVEDTLKRLRATRDEAEGIAAHTREIREANHFTQAIFGGNK